jgi:hypothetical protein
MMARFLGQDRIGGKRVTNRVDHQALGREVDLGNDVPRALMTDALDSFVAVRQQRAGAPGDALRERQLPAKVGGSHAGPILADALVDLVGTRVTVP